MEFAQMLAALGLEEHAAILEPGWEESQQSLPEGEIAFLTPAFLRRAGEEVPSSPQGIEQAIAVAARVAGDEALRALAWHYHRVLYGGDTPNWRRVTHWPAVEAALGDDAGLFCTLALLSGLPRMHAAHRAHGVPQEVTRQTLGDIHAGLHGLPEGHRRGANPHSVGWYSNFLRAELYRLGRLQFQFGTFGRPLRAFRHRESGAVLALSEAGVRYRADGYLAGAHEGGWTATLEVTDREAVGYPILPTGAPVPRLVSLPAREWRQVLAGPDPALYLHIPGGEPMGYDQCGDSLRRALAFYPRHYPDFPFRAFACHSWVLNGWFETALPPTSNMCRFQREVYLFPCEISPEEAAHVAFDSHESPPDLSQAPRNTSLQRALLAVLEAGEQIPVSAGGCFLLAEDVRWGEEVYRRQTLPVEVGEPS